MIRMDVYDIRWMYMICVCDIRMDAIRMDVYAIRMDVYAIRMDVYE